MPLSVKPATEYTTPSSSVTRLSMIGVGYQGRSDQAAPAAPVRGGASVCGDVFRLANGFQDAATSTRCSGAPAAVDWRLPPAGVKPRFCSTRFTCSERLPSLVRRTVWYRVSPLRWLTEMEAGLIVRRPAASDQSWRTTVPVAVETVAWLTP
jgi:hypothetical protein